MDTYKTEEQRKKLIFYRDKFWLWWYKLITKFIRQ